jgi:hypothetical protein
VEVVGESQSEPGCRSGIRLEGQVEADQSPASGQRKHAADAKEGPTDVTSLATLQRHMLARWQQIHHVSDGIGTQGRCATGGQRAWRARWHCAGHVVYCCCMLRAPWQRRQGGQEMEAGGLRGDDWYEWRQWEEDERTLARQAKSVEHVTTPDM